MDELTALRDRVDQANLVLRDTLRLRTQLVARIAAVKAARGLPALDPGREAEMLDRLFADLPPGVDEAALRDVFEAILRGARAQVVRAVRDDR